MDRHHSILEEPGFEMPENLKLLGKIEQLEDEVIDLRTSLEKHRKLEKKITGFKFQMDKQHHLQLENACLKSQLKENRELEEQLYQSQKMESLASLTVGIAHDFNNILQIILGHTQMAKFFKNKKGISDDDVFTEIENILYKGRGLTEQLLTFGRKKNGNPVPVNLNVPIRQIGKLLGRTIPKMIDIELNLAPDLKMINADPGQCEQVLINLCLNSRDSMHESGKIIIQTQNIILENDHPQTVLNSDTDEYILLTVSDTGKGMPQEILPRIFEPFYTTKASGKGTGLGLSIVNGILKNHGGFIEYDSEFNTGTTFRLYFPVLKKNETAWKDNNENGIDKSLYGTERVLIVDDEVNTLEIVKNQLRAYNYDVMTAETGEQAVLKYADVSTDLVILDIGMPGMGGIKYLKKLLSLNSEQKVIVTSGYSDSGHMKQTLDSGARAFLPKPYHFDSLLKTIRNILDGRS